MCHGARQGLEIDSFQPSPFDNAEDPFWETPCGSLCPSFIPNRANYRNTTYYDAFIYDYKFMKTDWVKVSQVGPRWQEASLAVEE